MVAAQHKLSRRALLAGACAVPVLPLPLPSGDDARVGGWAQAVERLACAEAEIEALAQCEEEEAYDNAVDRQIAALSRLLTAPAPDLAAAAWKIDLIARHAAWELTCGEAAFAALGEDVRRLGT